MKSKRSIIKIFAAVAFAGTIVVNFLANILPINGITTAEVSDRYFNLFAPAGITFSIWGLIYTLLTIYVLYQFGLFQKNHNNEREALFEKIGPYFIATSLANILWIFAWHYLLISVTIIFMVIILISLIRIANLIREYNLTPRERFFIQIPFSVYFGWITVATIANVTAFLVGIGWNGFGIPDHIWTTLILFVGAFIGILRMLNDREVAYGLVFVWAYSGILLRHTSPDGFNSQYSDVIVAAIACIILFFVTLGYIIYPSVVRSKKMGF
jgi:hypothetical protein